MSTARALVTSIAATALVAVGVVPAIASWPQVAAPYAPAQQDKIARPSPFQPINKARALKQKAKPRRDAEKEVGASLEGFGKKMGEAMGQAMLSAMGAALGPELAAVEREMTQVPGTVGKKFTARDQIGWVNASGTGSMVLFVREGENGWKNHLLFRGTSDSLKNAVEGTEGVCRGKYSGKEIDAKNKVTTYIIDDSAFLTGEQFDQLKAGHAPSTGAAPAGQPEPPVEKDFDAATHGWSFKGTVDGEGGTVAVFQKKGEKDIETKLVRDGQLVEPGFRVLDSESGLAKVNVDGRILTVTPW